jgi:DNA topoisomerase-3
MSKAGKYVSDKELRKAFELKDAGNSAESGSIGTEATRAGILAKISDNTNLVIIENEKGYKEKVWKTTQQAQDFCAVLPNEIKAPDISARWSIQQTSIVSGDLAVKNFIADIDNYLESRVNSVVNNGIKITANMDSCPTCNKGFLSKRKSTKGDFWACTNYPTCKSTFPDLNGKANTSAKPTRAPIVSKHKCPSCDKGLIRRKSKSKRKLSYFWGCSGYPECTVTMFDKKGKPNLETLKTTEKVE